MKMKRQKRHPKLRTDWLIVKLAHLSKNDKKHRRMLLIVFAEVSPLGKDGARV